MSPKKTQAGTWFASPAPPLSNMSSRKATRLPTGMCELANVLKRTQREKTSRASSTSGLAAPGLKGNQSENIKKTRKRRSRLRNQGSIDYLFDRACQNLLPSSRKAMQSRYHLSACSLDEKCGQLRRLRRKRWKLIDRANWTQTQQIPEAVTILSVGIS